mgnify:CR=1 FL=1
MNLVNLTISVLYYVHYIIYIMWCFFLSIVQMTSSSPSNILTWFSSVVAV